MAFGPGEQDVRKVQLTGGATYTLSLPKPWVVANELSPRDGVRVDWRPSGALRLTPIDMIDKQVKRVIINANSLPEDSLHDHLMGAYISGVDKIRINFNAGDGKKHRKEIRRFLRNTRGFETMSEDDKHTEIVCLINASEMPLSASINRMYLQLSSLIRDIMSVLEGDDIDLLSDSEERESEVDALLYLIERQVCIALDSHLVATSLKLGRNQAVEHSNLARCLERMMDHALQISQMIQEFDGGIKLKMEDSPIAQIPIWQEAIKQLMINIRTRDSHGIEKARHELKRAQNELILHEEGMMEGRRTARTLIIEIRLSESIRRLCAYSRDFGEILLNIKLYDEIIVDRQYD
jgi:phosphate uptake regulator